MGMWSHREQPIVEVHRFRQARQFNLKYFFFSQLCSVLVGLLKNLVGANNTAEVILPLWHQDRSVFHSIKIQFCLGQNNPLGWLISHPEKSETVSKFGQKTI